MAFNPDDYLKSKKSGGFDVDAYLAGKSSSPNGPGMLESGLRGAAQGATLGFADELTGGLESLFTDKTYEQARDESRANYKAAADANPISYGAGNIGGAVATSLVVPGLGGAATVAGRAGQAALAGGVSGLGLSEAKDAGGLAQDALIGAGTGAALSGIADKVIAPAMAKVGSLADSALAASASKSQTINRGLAKGAKFLAGVDDEAALRQIERPLQTAAAEADGFAYKIGQNAVHDADALGSKLGSNVNSAERQLMSDFGDVPFENSRILSDKIDDFLTLNEPSPKGYSALAKDQFDELKSMADNLRAGNATGEDLVKLRKYLDHVERLAGKYDQEGTSPYVNMLKNLRHDADQMLDRIDPRFDNANKAYAQYKRDTSMLSGTSNEGRAESMINNLYGANKNAQQEAAARLFRPDTMEAAKDIAANKAFTNARGPAGSEHGLRRMAGLMFALPTGGLSAVATSPQAWQKGLRWTGRLEQAIQTNPQMFGKYAGVMADALQRGPRAVAATHFILSQRDPGYRDAVMSLQDDDK